MSRMFGKVAFLAILLVAGCLDGRTSYQGTTVGALAIPPGGGDQTFDCAGYSVTARCEHECAGSIVCSEVAADEPIAARVSVVLEPESEQRLKEADDFLTLIFETPVNPHQSPDFVTEELLVAAIQDEEGLYPLECEQEIDMWSRTVRLTCSGIDDTCEVSLCRTDHDLSGQFKQGDDGKTTEAVLCVLKGGLVLANERKPSFSIVGGSASAEPELGWFSNGASVFQLPLSSPECARFSRLPPSNDATPGLRGGAIRVEDGTIAKDDCVGRNVTYTFSLIVPSGATVPPIGGGTGLSTVAISAPELMQWVAQPGATPQLATTPAPGAFGIVGAFSIVGGTRETAVPFPPGVPPPPPGVPLPTEPILSVVLFDELGEELRSLALGGYVDGRASAVVLSAIEGSERTDVLVSYGSIPLTLTGWNPDIDDFGASQVSPNFTNVTDVSPYGGNPESGGAVIAWFGGGSLSFVEYDPTPHAFSSAGSVTSAQFAGASGGPVSAFRRQAGGQTLFVTDGQPGELWTHAGGAANATKVGNLGNGPRQIRFLGEIGVVSNFDSGTLTVVRWENGGTVTIVGTVTVGDGPIGLDLRLNSAGNIEVLSTGFNNHTYTFTVLSPTGAVIGTPVTRTAPEGGLNPVHAIFVNAAGTRIGITCNGSDEVLIFDLPGS